MRGSIRVFLGLLVAFGVAGGMDTATDSDLIPLVIAGVVGIVLMYSGTMAMKGLK